jgi:type III secretory pathway lipoprotein EscJ
MNMIDRQQHDGGRIRDWMGRIESDLDRLDDKWQKSVDDIKAFIKSEIADLKNEQISDLRRELSLTNNRIDQQGLTLSDVKSKQERWDTSAGVVHWIIRLVFAIFGAVAGIMGWENIPRH